MKFDTYCKILVFVYVIEMIKSQETTGAIDEAEVITVEEYTTQSPDLPVSVQTEGPTTSNVITTVGTKKVESELSIESNEEANLLTTELLLDETTVRSSKLPNIRFPMQVSPKEDKEEGNTVAVKTTTEEPKLPEDKKCDFGVAGKLNWCSWIVESGGDIEWELGCGKSHLIFGGPAIDNTQKDVNGGYAFMELSERRARSLKRSGDLEARLHSPVMKSTILEPDQGEKCFSFSYASSNSGSLEIMLTDVKTNETRIMWKSLTPNENNEWERASFLYAHNDDHRITIVGRPTNPMLTRKRPGCHFLAIDNIQIGKLSNSNCKGHCAFTKDICNWENYQNDDFDWQLDRSSKYADSGPSTDGSNFGKFVQIGAYAYISSDFPRKPGDIAILMSEEFSTSESPLCMEFKANLYGANDGQLRVYQVSEDVMVEKWIRRNGDYKQRWIQSQVLLSSNKPFRVAFEVKVSSEGRGIIAIDDISFHQGTCIVMPEVAASKANGVCDFESEQVCGWTNVPGMHVWVRKFPNVGGIPEYDFYKQNTSGHYMGVRGSGYSSATLRSPLINPSSAPCVSFLYIMWKNFSEQSGPSLGELKVSLLEVDGEVESKTLLWKTRGHQDEKWMTGRSPILNEEKKVPETPYRIEIEEESYFPSHNGLPIEPAVIAIDNIFVYDGICEIYPSMAQTIQGECSFQNNLCGWSLDIGTTTNSEEESFVKSHNQWFLTKLGSPSGIDDHTYKRITGGYIYFHIDKHIGSQEIKHTMVNSPILKKTTPRKICFTFWYRGTVAGATNVTLSVNLLTLDDGMKVEDSKSDVVWRETKTTQNQWVYGRVPITLPPGKYTRFQFEGSAVDAGYCIDDIIILQGYCTYQPTEIGNTIKSSR